MAFYKSDIVNIELNTGKIHRSFMLHSIGSADISANRFGIRVFRDGEPVNLSGAACYGYFRNSHGQNIALTSYGTVSGNEAYVTLPQACYNYEGQFCLSIKLVGGGVTGTMRIVDGVVDNTNTGSAVAPTGTVPTYTEVLAVYQDAIDAIDDVNELKSDVNNSKITYNLYHGTPANGAVLFRKSDLLDAGKFYYRMTVPTGKASYIELMDSSGTRISYIGKGSSSGGDLSYEGWETIPSGFEYAKFTTTSTTAGESEIYLSTNVLTQNGILSAFDEINTLSENCGDISELIKPVNLYNKDSELNKDGYKVTLSGNYESLSGSSVSHPIKIEAGKSYTFKYSASYYGTTTNSVVRWCDKQGNLTNLDIGGTYATNNGTASGTFTPTAEQISLFGNYVCVNVRESDKGVMIFVEGDSLPSYSAYFEPYYIVKESALPDNIPLPTNAQNNVLYGKKAAFTGDSICYGAGYAGGYPSIIGSENNMTISNIGVSGGTLCSGTQRFCISESVDNMPEGYDYYIVEGGVNDASQEHGETLGTLSSGYSSTLDTTTLYGAMESLCKKLQTNFPAKKYGFIFPHNCYGDTSAWNTGWRDAMKTCLKKWGIPYLDLSDECAQLRNIDALRVYTSSSDGWHPTEAGYKAYYVPKIEAWMKTL